MRRVTMVVIGNGNSSRANIEALIGDFLDSVDKADFAYVSSKKSEGVTRAEQFAESRGIAVHAHDSLESLYKSMKDIRLFMLWDDEDPDCQEVASFAQEHNIPMFDLTDGLVRITTKAETIEPIVRTEIPELEIPTKTTPVVSVIDEPEEDSEEEIEEYTDLGEMLMEAFEEIGRVMAGAFIEEVKRLLKEDDAE